MTLNNTQAVIPVPSKQSRKWMLLIYKFTSELAPLIIISMLALWYYLANTFNSNPYNDNRHISGSLYKVSLDCAMFHIG